MRRIAGTPSEEAALRAWREAVGVRLHALRTARRLSAEALGAAARIDRATVYRIEAGVGNANMGALWRIARALGVGLHDLLPDTPRGRRYGLVDLARVRGLIGQLQHELERCAHEPGREGGKEKEGEPEWD
jgi:transcriptional regulator with XRE-family HTH domain